MKAELKKLHDQVAKLSTREQEILRLRYADGLNYKDLAAASNLTTEEVKGHLLSAINTLRAVPAGDEKGRFLSFVHGELDEAETQKMAEWVEADADARKEFESLLAMSDALTDLYDALANEKPKAPPKKSSSTLDKIRKTASALKSGKKPVMAKPRMLIAGGFFALAAAIVIYIFVDMSSGTSPEPMTDEAAIAAAKAADQAAAVGAPGAESALPDTANKPVDAHTAEQVPDDPPAGDATAPAAPPDAAAKFEPPPPAPLATPPPEPAPAPAASAKGSKSMSVDAAKTVISKNLNKKTALTFLAKKLNGPSCLPASDKKTKAIKVSISLKKDGTYTNVAVTAPAAGKLAIAKCLKGKLGATAKSLKSSNKTGGKITLVLKT